MDITIKEMAKNLKNYSECRIVYHIRPDGDCIGSAYALCIALQSMGNAMTARSIMEESARRFLEEVVI